MRCLLLICLCSMVLTGCATVGIGVTMTLGDFVQALGAEAGVDLQAAAERVVAGMKQETSRAM